MYKCACMYIHTVCIIWCEHAQCMHVDHSPSHLTLSSMLAFSQPIIMHFTASIPSLHTQQHTLQPLIHTSCLLTAPLPDIHPHTNSLMPSMSAPAALSLHFTLNPASLSFVSALEINIDTLHTIMAWRVGGTEDMCVHIIYV